MADLEALVRPAGMPVELFDSICADYQKARNTYNKATTRQNCRPATLARALTARNTQHANAKTLLEGWSTSQDLRQLINIGNTSAAEALRLLNQASTRSADNHRDVMNGLLQLQNSLASSSSFARPADVEMRPVDEVPSDVCMICHDDSPDGPAMPCCFQGNHKACLSCYTECIERTVEPDFKCPHCRTAFKNCVPVGNVAALGRFSAFMCALYPTHENVIEALVNSRSAPRKLVLLKHLAFFNTPEGPMPLGDISQMLGNMELDDPNIHMEVNILHDHLFLASPSKWARFIVSDESIESKHAHMQQVMPLQFLSAPGDDIHAFVERACNGVWFHHYNLIEVRVKGCVYPLYYYFEEFKRIRGQETVVVLVVDPDFVAQVDPVEIPFSAIESCKNVPFGYTLFNSSSSNHNLPKHVAFRLYGERWQQCYVKELIRGGYGNRLVIAAYPESLFTRTVYNGMVEQFEYLTDLHISEEVNVVGVPEERPDHFVVRVVCSHTCPAETRDRISPDATFLFLGYCSQYMSAQIPRALSLILARDNGWGARVALSNNWVAALIYDQSI